MLIYNEPLLSNLHKAATCRYTMQGWPLNPLSPDSDQDQFSPNNIHMLPEKWLWELIKHDHQRKNSLFCYQTLSTFFFFEGMYEGQYGEFICGYRGLKG